MNKKIGDNTYAVVRLCLAGSNQLHTLAQDRQFHSNKRHSVTLQISLLLWYYMDEIAAEHRVFYIWNVGWSGLGGEWSAASGCGFTWLAGCGATTPPYNHPFHLCNTHQQTIVAEDLWNQEYQMRALNKRSYFPSPEIGQKTWHGAKGLFRFDFCDFMNNLYWNQPTTGLLQN